MKIETCPLWGTQYPATGVYIPETKTNQIEYSARSGGGYVLAEELLNSKALTLSDDAKARLTSWLVDQRLLGVAAPRITASIVARVIALPPLAVHQRARQLLQFLAWKSPTVSAEIGLISTIDPNHAAAQVLFEAMAWTESTNDSDVTYLADYLVQQRWVGKHQNGPLYRVTVDGHHEIAQDEVNVSSSQAFVAMWFDREMEADYDQGIEPAIEASGYEPKRIDRDPAVHKVDDAIIAEIRRSRFLIADMTCGSDGPRASVYYEAGFAHGLGIEVIYSCREDSLDRLAFDTRQYNHIVWQDAAQLKRALIDRIAARIGYRPLLNRDKF